MTQKKQQNFFHFLISKIIPHFLKHFFYILIQKRAPVLAE